MRSERFGGLVGLAVAALAGCGGMPDESQSVGQDSAPLTTGVFTLHNYQTGLCLGIAAGTPTPGTPLIVWTCDTSANQNWQQQQPWGDSGDLIELKNFVASDRCLNMQQPYYGTNGNRAIIDTCPNGNGQPTFFPDLWHAKYAGKDLSDHECYYFLAAWTNESQTLGVAGGRTDIGAPVIVWQNFDNQYTHPDQIWCVY